MDYFGECGVNEIVDTVTRFLLGPPKLPPTAKILDVGAGSGFFTIKIAKKLQTKLPKASIYAMDLTPAMLLQLTRKKTKIIPFVGIAENIKDSTQEAKKSLNIPHKFDAVFSTLMLHHSKQPEKTFKSIKEALKKKGKAIVIDLCEHSFKDFKTEMGDVHLGFKPENIHKMARKHFREVRVDRLPGLSCECSGRAAEIFMVTMENPSQT
jgi:ubiquinone/menaquinone biosynthesis C-methylase UbiE